MRLLSLFLGCSVMLALTGCGTTPAEAPDPAPAGPTPAVSVPEPASADGTGLLSARRPGDETPAPPSRSPSEGRGKPTVSGKLHFSKGNPVVGGRFLSQDDLVRFFGKDWRKHRGRHLRVWGTLDTYVCPPQAQCLISGEIPQLTDATHMEWGPSEPGE